MVVCRQGPDHAAEITKPPNITEKSSRCAKPESPIPIPVNFRNPSHAHRKIAVAACAYVGALKVARGNMLAMGVQTLSHTLPACDHAHISKSKLLASPCYPYSSPIYVYILSPISPLRSLDYSSYNRCAASKTQA